MGKITFKRGSGDHVWYETIDENTSFNDWFNEEIKAGIYAIIIAIIIGVIIFISLKLFLPKPEYKEPDFLIENKMELVNPNSITYFS